MKEIDPPGNIDFQTLGRQHSGISYNKNTILFSFKL